MIRSKPTDQGPGEWSTLLPLRYGNLGTLADSDPTQSQPALCRQDWSVRVGALRQSRALGRR